MNAAPQPAHRGFAPRQVPALAPVTCRYCGETIQTDGMVVRVLKGWGHLECRLALQSAEQAALSKTSKARDRRGGIRSEKKDA